MVLEEKSANLVLAEGFGIDAVCVDTHVHRINNRLGYVNTETPEETEMALRRQLPKKYWMKYNTLLVAYGQKVCVPISPFCSKCVISKYCQKRGVDRSRWLLICYCTKSIDTQLPIDSNFIFFIPWAKLDSL